MFGRIKAFCMARRRKIVTVLAVFAFLWLGNHFWSCYRAKDAAGIYLVDGGKYLIVLGHSPWKGLIHKEGYVRIAPDIPAVPGAGTSMIVGMTRSRLRLKQKHMEQPADCTAALWVELDLIPSSAREGDWDLVKSQTGSSVRPRLFGTGGLSPRNWADWAMRRGDLAMGNGFLNAAVNAGTYDFADNPLKSYLHRIDDQRLCEYFKTRRESDPNKEQLVLIKSILNDHPGDPFLELHAIEMEALVGDADTADSTLQEWKLRNPQNPRDPLSQSAHLVGNIVSLAMAEKRGYPKDSFRNFFTGTGVRPTTASWEERVEWLKKLVGYEYLFPEVVPLIGDLWPDSVAQIPNYFEAQVGLKRVLVTSDFALLQGDREESLALLAGSYRLGQSMNIGYPFMSRSIGDNLRAIALNGLIVYVLNACETPEDFVECWEMLKRLHDVPYRIDGKYMPVHATASFIDISQYGGWTPNFDFETRSTVRDVRFDLVRAALAAKHCLLRTNEFPKKDDDFAPFLADGLPDDPFGDKSVKYKQKNSDVFSIYGLGPDKDDDFASVQYDSTNGTMSDGDIYLDIPREREFPFPRDGVKAKNAHELLSQFPNGLPEDPFAERTEGGKYPLSIIESSTATRAIVVSCGPDKNHPLRPAGRTPSVRPEDSTDSLEECVFLPGNSLENVSYDREGKALVPKGYWYLEPMYDPSNGTTSSGDIFMEVPR